MNCCLTCGKEGLPKWKKYCNRECYNNRELGEKRFTEDYKKVIAERTRLQNLNYTAEQRAEVNRKIGEKKKVPISKETIKAYVDIKNIGLTCSDTVFAKKLGISVRVFYRLINENGFYEEFEKRPKFIDKKVQNMSNEEQIVFIKDLKVLEWDKMLNKYGITKKPLEHIYRSLKIPKVCKRVNRKETNPERITRQILEELGVGFKQEKYVPRMLYRSDFLIGENKVIEVQGDYFHTNPMLYDSTKITSLQKDNIRNDMNKDKYYRDNGYKVLYIWEEDIKNNIEKVRKQIIKYLNMETKNPISKMFKEAFGHDYINMIPNKKISVSHRNVGVKSYNHETNEIEFNKVLNIVRKNDAKEYTTITSCGLKIKTSGNHKFYIKNNENKETYEEVENIVDSLSKNRYELLKESGEWVSISDITVSSELVPILDMEVENVHNYFSNGVLSHNTVYGSPLTEPGGNASKFYASIKIELKKKTGEDKDEHGDIKNSMVTAKTLKNKTAPPFRSCEFDILFGEGIDRISELIYWGVKSEVITKAGSWFSYGDLKIGQGQSTVKDLLKDNPELAEEIEAKIRKHYKI